MSKILCIIDGMTDPSFKIGTYPFLSSMHLLSYVDTTQGHTPESLGCILRLLGVKEIPPHMRGYAEALAYGISVHKDDLILRGSWFSLDDKGYCDLPIEAPPVLFHNDNDVRYYQLEQYKSLLIFSGMAACIDDMLTYPPYECSGIKAQSFSPKGCRAASRVFNSELTKGRCLLLWGQSVWARIAPFQQKAAVVCGTAVVKGIAKLLGMSLFVPSGATGDTDTNLYEKMQMTLNAAQDYPFVLLHINGADEAGHRKDQKEKNDFLQKVDALVIRRLLESGHSISVVADHGTDPVTGLHIADNQPLFTMK